MMFSTIAKGESLFFLLCLLYPHFENTNEKNSQKLFYEHLTAFCFLMLIKTVYSEINV